MNLNEWAELYDDLGFNCFPLKNRSKEPAINWGDYQDKKYDGKFLEGQNIGIITGKISNLVVIDMDDKSLFQIVFKQWKELLHHTLVIETARGYHIYTRPKNGDFINTKLKDSQGRGIDIKGEGGYVVAPPSIHPEGDMYKVISFVRTIEPIDIPGFINGLKIVLLTINKIKRRLLPKNF